MPPFFLNDGNIIHEEPAVVEQYFEPANVKEKRDIGVFHTNKSYVNLSNKAITQAKIIMRNHLYVFFHDY